MKVNLIDYVQSAPVPTVYSGIWDMETRIEKAAWQLARTGVDYWGAMAAYHEDFFDSLQKSINYFYERESQRIGNNSPEAIPTYRQLLDFNLELVVDAITSSIEVMIDYHPEEIIKAMNALIATMSGDNETDIFTYIDRISDHVRLVAHDYPQAIENISAEFGFHFDAGGYRKIAETERFTCYQVLPTEPDIDVRNDGKPVLIIHPYVLGADILAFLPGENKSYVHCFANQGIPTYIRILKDIHNNPAVQTTTLEDDIRDTKSFCEIIKQNHGQMLTLNGYCQGGLISLCTLLSGEVDGLVDAHITCVAPIDGSRSDGFQWFLEKLPDRFNDLAYGTKTLPNGNKVTDGDLMAWVYRLKSIEHEYPFVSFYRDLAMLGQLRDKGSKISKTAAALNYWLRQQRHDLPLEITRLSFISYNTPITTDGTLPFKAFDRSLNIKRLAEKGIPMQICYGKQDALVEKACALAPLDYIQAEATAFPKGHVAIATSWSLPTSEYALHTRFGNGLRGPVRFHLDLEEGSVL